MIFLLQKVAKKGLKTSLSLKKSVLKGIGSTSTYMRGSILCKEMNISVFEESVWHKNDGSLVSLSLKQSYFIKIMKSSK